MRPDKTSLAGCKKRGKWLPVKLLRAEQCEDPAGERKPSQFCQAFCEKLADETEKLGATRSFEYEPGVKYITRFLNR